MQSCQEAWLSSFERLDLPQLSPVCSAFVLSEEAACLFRCIPFVKLFSLRYYGPDLYAAYFECIFVATVAQSSVQVSKEEPFAALFGELEQAFRTLVAQGMLGKVGHACKHAGQHSGMLFCCLAGTPCPKEAAFFYRGSYGPRA